MTPALTIRCTGCGTSIPTVSAPCRCVRPGGGALIQFSPPAPSSSRPARPARRAPARGREVENLMRDALERAGLRADKHYIREYAWALDEGRGYRFDFRLVGYPLAVECEGGAHAIKRQHLEDCQRSSLAAALGWRVLRVHRAMIESGEAVALVRRAIETYRAERAS